MAYPSREARRALARMRVTLDDQPAQIIGVHRAFAIIVTNDGRSQQEWSWAAVERIVEFGGRFVS